MKNLKELRKKRNLSQLRLAMELGLSQQTIHKYESGKAEPDIRTLIELARFFHVSVDYLIGNESDVSDKKTPRQKASRLGSEIMLSLSPEEYHFMTLYRRLSRVTKSAFNQILEDIRTP